jgi:cystathionine gamma-synthase
MAMDPTTRIVHAGQEIDGAYNSITAPIYQTSVFRYEGLGESKGYEYSRAGNPTRDALEALVSDLEGGAGAIATASGVATFSTVLAAVEGNPHIIICHDCYGGAARLLSLMAAQKKLSVSFVDMNDEAALASALRAETRIVWAESPTNPLLNIVDLGRVGAFTKRHGLLFIVDNTFMTPLWQRPIEFGADVVMHSTTKYLNGHADVIGGVLVARTAEFLAKLRLAAKTYGAIGGPFDCWLTLRGSKTLALRLKQHEENAFALARFLLEQPQALQVYYPGLPSHPGHALAARQQKGFGGVVSFRLRGGVIAAKQLIARLKLFKLAASLGGVESTINHSATMSHGGMPAEQRHNAGISDDLLRLSVGIEAAADLTADLGQALDGL